MIKTIANWLSDQINSFSVSIAGFCSGLILGEVKVEVIPLPIEHFITVILQWTSFSVGIAAGVWTIYIGRKRYLKRKNES